MKLASTLLALVGCVGAMVTPSAKYILVTAPTEKALYVSKVPGAREASDNQPMTVRRLTPNSWSAVVFEKPEGLAVDSQRGLLYVADIGKRAIIAMSVYEKNEFLTDPSVSPMARNATVHVEDPREIITDVNAKWVAVDAVGNLFWTELSSNAIYTMALDTVMDKLKSAPSSLSTDTDSSEDATTTTTPDDPGGAAPAPPPSTELDAAEASAADASAADASAAAPVVSTLQMSADDDAADATAATADAADAADATAGQTSAAAGVAAEQTTEQTDVLVTEHAVQLYNGLGDAPLAKPQGIAVDGFSVYWANGQEGQAQGVLIKGLEDPPDEDRNAQLVRLATNIDTAHGVCLTGSRVFFTSAEKSMYSMRTNGGTIKLVSDRLGQPRGCVYDGDGTIYVADKMEGKVFSFAGAAPSLGGRQLTHAFDVPEAHGLAIFTGRAGRSHFALTVLLAVMTALYQ